MKTPPRNFFFFKYIHFMSVGFFLLAAGLVIFWSSGALAAPPAENNISAAIFIEDDFGASAETAGAESLRQNKNIFPILIILLLAIVSTSLFFSLQDEDDKLKV